jgi:ADP-dependent NAD(P)H-hydrate dehydratase / NAD(P)H-hydrate epimerase
LKFTKLTEKWMEGKLPKRPKEAHKGTFGKVLVFAGSDNFPGAAYLCCEAAYRVGAGLVTLATEPEVKIIVSRKLPEVTFLRNDEAIKKIDEYDALLVGPGLGQKDELIRKFFDLTLPPAVIDADGLNILSKIGEWWGRLGGSVVLTPHAGEMARLTGQSVEKIQPDRINVAQYYAKKWQKIIVLKGANTVIADSLGETLVSPFANPSLATAGTGDVLSGVIAGFLAQGLDPVSAAGVGVYIHGLAGENISLASDLLPLLPQIIKKLTLIY